MDDKIRSWIDRNLDIGQYDLRKITSGGANYCYIIEAEDRLVLKLSRQVSESLLEYEAKVLRFLEEKQIQHVPRLTHIDTNPEQFDTPILVQTHVGEQNIRENLNAENMEALAELLSKIHQIPIEEYNRYFNKKHPISQTPYEFVKERQEKYHKKFYKKYRKLAKNPKPEITQHYKRCQEILEQLKQFDTELQLCFTNTDLVDNVRTDKNQEAYIIDWETGGVGNAANSIMEFLNKGDLIDKKDEFLQIYNKYDPIRLPDKLLDLLLEKSLIGNMLWAAKFKEKTKEGEGNAQKYKKILQERLQLCRENIPL